MFFFFRPLAWRYSFIYTTPPQQTDSVFLFFNWTLTLTSHAQSLELTQIHHHRYLVIQLPPGTETKTAECSWQSSTCVPWWTVGGISAFGSSHECWIVIIFFFFSIAVGRGVVTAISKGVPVYVLFYFFLRRPKLETRIPSWQWYKTKFCIPMYDTLFGATPDGNGKDNPASISVTGWFKHTTPNCFRRQCPRRFWELDPEILHVFWCAPAEPSRMGVFCFLFFRQTFGFCFCFWYLGLKETPHFRRKKNKKENNIRKRPAGHLDFCAVKCKNYGLASLSLGFRVYSMLGVKFDLILVLRSQFFEFLAKLCTNMPWSTWKRLVQKKKGIFFFLQ